MKTISIINLKGGDVNGTDYLADVRKALGKA